MSGKYGDGEFYYLDTEPVIGRLHFACRHPWMPRVF